MLRIKRRRKWELNFSWKRYDNLRDGGMLPRLYHVPTDSFSLLLGWAREQQLFVSGNWKHVAEEKAGSDRAVYWHDETSVDENKQMHNCGVREGRISHGNQRQSFFFLFTSTSFFPPEKSTCIFSIPGELWVIEDKLSLKIIQDKKMLDRISIWVLFIQWSTYRTSSLVQNYTDMTRTWLCQDKKMM